MSRARRRRRFLAGNRYAYRHRFLGNWTPGYQRAWLAVSRDLNWRWARRVWRDGGRPDAAGQVPYRTPWQPRGHMGRYVSDPTGQLRAEDAAVARLETLSLECGTGDG